ncbi:MAG TPA: DNA repair protein RadA [Thiobacillaceae bacterium]|nr:DNA repair protein RadA [Thiobacillaceae bacterium]HNU64709.1 DNA repair protein RadA [Thiobacillaceae bacterium]
MAKPTSIHVCAQCGGQTSKWQGQCPHCLAWNTLSESVLEAKGHRFSSLAASGEVVRLGAVQAREIARLETGQPEFDRVLGGGLVGGGVVLLGGDPGIGKSTLLLQALADISARARTLYVSGEESAEQIALRAQRLGLAADIPLLTEIRMEAILTALRTERPQVAVIDSIQTVYTQQLQSAPGSVAQVRECAQELTRHAKQAGICILLVGHVTKEGTLAGPRVLEHIVDTVLYFEGDTGSSFRLIRAFKNRFGAVNELGVFAMTDKGLKGVSNPSALFLNRDGREAPGSCVVVALEGTRPLLVEIQALLDTAHGGNPRRLSVGLDGSRLAMLLAVLHRHGGVPCYDQDVFVNAVGGVKISEPAADLAVALAVVSSLRTKPIPHKLAAFGEVGLAGEIRPVQRGQERLKEVAKLGFTQALCPRANLPKTKVPGLEVKGVTSLAEALDYFRGL